MKFLLATMITFLSWNSFAQVLPINPCNERGLKWVEESIEDWKKDEGYSTVWYIKNLKGQILGYYSVDPSSTESVHAEICHSVDIEDITVASQWYYWIYEKENSNPVTWKKNKEYKISSDEGFAFFKVINSDTKGNIKAFMRVVGWDDDSRELTIQSSIVTFEKRD